MRKAVMVTAVLALGACNRQPEVSATNASVAEVAEKVRKAGAGESFVRPGLWQSKFTMEKLDIPGMPPEMAGRMKSMMADQQAKGFTTCLTAADVKRPSEDFFAGKNKQCRYDRFTMGGGKIDAVMRCGDAQASQVMVMTGTYSPDAYRMHMSNKVEASARGAAGAMTMEMQVESHRIGECTGKEAQAKQ